MRIVLLSFFSYSLISDISIRQWRDRKKKIVTRFRLQYITRSIFGGNGVEWNGGYNLWKTIVGEGWLSFFGIFFLTFRLMGHRRAYKERLSDC